MKQTRRPEDEEQLNKTPETPAAADAPQEEPAYSLEEIMNEFGGWTKRDAPAPAEPVTDETVRLAVLAAEAKGEEKPAEPPAGGDTIRFTPVEEEKAPEPERPAVWTYRGEPDPERPAPDPKEARELARAERREKRQAEKRRRQLERFQKKEARKKRAQEQPEHTFASPEAAYAFYAAASGTRLRLLVSTLLCLGSVLLLVLSTPLITGAFSDHAAVFSAAMLGLLLLQAVCSYDVCLSGVIALLRFRFDQYSMLFLALCAVVADAFFAVAEGRTPFCTVAGILLLLALWGRDLLYDARRRSLRGEILHPLAEADLPQDLVGRQRILAQLACDLHVFQCRHIGQQIVKLEHEPDLVAAVGRQALAAVVRHVLAREQHMAGGKPVHAAEDVQERGLARAGLADDDADLPLVDRKRRVLQRLNAHVSHLIGLTDMVKYNKILHASAPHFFCFLNSILCHTGTHFA